MRCLRVCLLSVGVMAASALAAAPALASPEWWVRKTGAAVGEPLSGIETLNQEGELSVLRPPASTFKCLMKGYERIEDPGPVGLGETTAFEGICEKGAPYPCTAGETAEFVQIGPPQVSELEKIGTKIFDVFKVLEIEFRCLSSGGSAIYRSIAQVKPEVGVSRLKFAGLPSGELEVVPPVPGVPRLSFKGTYFSAPASAAYKLVRAK
jgi:hypothetical protein